MNRIFSDEELKDMSARTADLLTEAIEAGDKERAKRLASRMYREFSFMHDLYVDWSGKFMDHIYTNYGEEALYQALRQVTTPTTRQLTDDMTKNVMNPDFRLRVEGLAGILRGHLQPIKVNEDDEKVCITMEPCGSGQRLIESGAYEPPCNLTMIQKPHPMTWGMTDFPIYCTHEPVLDILSIEGLGYPSVVVLPPEKVARRESCKFCLYKNVEDIPEEVYTRVGKQKPRDV
jgi:hypothetical protein